MEQREKSVLRESDERTEKSVAKFLDDTFYKEEFISSPLRVSSKDKQVNGVDTEFEYNNEHILCDEKSTAQWRDISTFTLELSFINKTNNLNEGWLTNDKEINDSFLLVWLNNDSVEVCLVKRDSIMRYLESIGWTKEKLRKKAHNIRYEGDTNMGNLYKNGCKFCYTTRLPEKPINIQLHKDTYKSLALVYKKYDTDLFKKN